MLPPGTYVLKAELPSFSTVERTIELNVGGVLTIDTTLQVGGVTETVKVNVELAAGRNGSDDAHDDSEL